MQHLAQPHPRLLQTARHQRGMHRQRRSVYGHGLLGLPSVVGRVRPGIPPVGVRSGYV